MMAGDNEELTPGGVVDSTTTIRAGDKVDGAPEARMGAVMTAPLVLVLDCNADMS